MKKNVNLNRWVFYVLLVLILAPIIIFLWKMAFSIKINLTEEPLRLSNYLSNIFQVILVFLGGLVFFQIKQAKEDLATRCIRESRSRALDLSEKYAKEIIPKIEESNKLARSKGLEISEYSVDDFYLDEIISDKEKQQYEKDVKIFNDNPDLYKVSVETLNFLEALAMNFTKGIADEEIVFTALSQTYCKFIKNNTAFICLLRGRKYNIYTNIVYLYKIWYNRIEENGFKLQEKNVKEQLSASKAKSIDPPQVIGVKK